MSWDGLTNLNKRRMRKNIKQKNISVLKKAEEEYLKRLYNRLCHEMFLDKYFEDEERILFVRWLNVSRRS